MNWSIESSDNLQHLNGPIFWFPAFGGVRLLGCPGIPRWPEFFYSKFLHHFMGTRMSPLGYCYSSRGVHPLIGQIGTFVSKFVPRKYDVRKKITTFIPHCAGQYIRAQIRYWGRRQLLSSFRPIVFVSKPEVPLLNILTAGAALYGQVP